MKLRLHKPRVYVETSVISYLTSRPSRDVLLLAHQEITGQWWQEDRHAFNLFISEIVEKEAGVGDPTAAQARLLALSDIERLPVTPEALLLTRQLMVAMRLPKRVEADAAHIAIAAVHRMDYLLTWNCKHIANQQMMEIARNICHLAGHKAPALCTPELLQELP